MQHVMLRQGKEWRINVTGKPVDAAHSQRLARIERAKKTFCGIARLYGSNAVWLAEEGVVISTNPLEALAQHPYDRWRIQALKQVGLSYRGMYAAR